MLEIAAVIISKPARVYLSHTDNVPGKARCQFCSFFLGRKCKKYYMKVGESKVQAS